MSDHEYTKTLSRELDTERAAHAATKADLDAARAALEKAERELIETQNALRVQNDLALERLAAVQAAKDERDEWRRAFDAEIEGAGALRESCGARDDETFPAFVKRLWSESAAKDERIAALAKRWERDADLREATLPQSVIARVERAFVHDLRRLLDASPAQTLEAKP